MLNIKHLYYFHVFAKNLSNSKAAAALGITPSALSNQLKELSKTLGAPVTEKCGSKTVLTERGRMVLSYTSQIFTPYEQLSAQVRAPEIYRSHFRVGVSEDLAPHLALDLLSLIGKINFEKSEDVGIHFGLWDNLFSGIAAGDLDLVICASNTEPPENPDIHTKHLHFPVQLFAESALVLNQEQLAESLWEPGQAIEFANRVALPILIPTPQSTLGEETQKYLDNSPVRPKRTMKCNSASMTIRLIECGYAVGFLPVPAFLDFRSVQAVVVLGPEGGFWTQEVYLMIRIDSEKSKFGMPDQDEALKSKCDLN